MLYPITKLGVLFQKILNVLSSLAETLTFVREPRAAFLDQACVDTHIDHLTRAEFVRKIVLPGALPGFFVALRLAVAPMTNDFVALLKDSSLVSVITVVELTKRMTIVAEIRPRGPYSLRLSARLSKRPA